jgi:hypothetical protein
VGKEPRAGAGEAEVEVEAEVEAEVEVGEVAEVEVAEVEARVEAEAKPEVAEWARAPSKAFRAAHSPASCRVAASRSQARRWRAGAARSGWRGRPLQRPTRSCAAQDAECATAECATGPRGLPYGSR